MRHFVSGSLFAGLLSLVCLAEAQIAGPNTKIEAGRNYRLVVDLGQVDADTTLRFPKKSVGSNDCLGPGFPDLYQKVTSVSVRSYTGSQTGKAVIYSQTFPARAETLTVTGNVRQVTVSGVWIDSVRVLDTGTLPNLNSVMVYVTD